MINKISQRPRILFLIDGFGALLSAFLLGVVLTTFESTFGMPREVLYFLAFLPCLFALYDFGCYFRITDNWSFFLKVIAFANLAYCFVSIGFILLHYQRLTALGLIYFLLELAILTILISIEFKIAAKLTTKTS